MTKFTKKKLSRAAQFGSRAHMLDTIHLSYLTVLDTIAEAMNNSPIKPRTSYKERFELGQRLLKYWGVKK